jgi:tetratricopeptide (TPR) repeat protein
VKYPITSMITWADWFAYTEISGVAALLSFVGWHYGGIGDMQITLRLMGRLHNSLSNQDKAEEYLRSALAIQVAGLGSGHPATAYTQIELAESLLAKGESEEALEHAAASDETLTAALSDSHELTMRARGIHGAALQATGDWRLQGRGEAASLKL